MDDYDEIGPEGYRIKVPTRALPTGTPSLTVPSNVRIENRPADLHDMMIGEARRNAEFDPHRKERDLMDAVDMALLFLSGGSAAKSGATKLARIPNPRPSAEHVMQELKTPVESGERIVAKGKHPLAMRTYDLEPTGVKVESVDPLYPGEGRNYDKLVNAYRQSIVYDRGNPLYMTEMQNLRKGEGTDLTKFGRHAIPEIMEGADVAGATAARSRLKGSIPAREVEFLDVPNHPEFEWFRPSKTDPVMKEKTPPVRYEYPDYGEL